MIRKDFTECLEYPLLIYTKPTTIFVAGIPSLVAFEITVAVTIYAKIIERKLAKRHNLTLIMPQMPGKHQVSSSQQPVQIQELSVTRFLTGPSASNTLPPVNNIINNETKDNLFV